MSRVNITTRRHPLYTVWASRWEFFLSSYLGGEDYIATNLFQYFKEGDKEFAARVQRAYRENHSKRVVDLVNSYLFKEEPVRNTDNALLREFQENADGQGHTISRFMRAASIWASVLGRVYIVVDKPALDDEERTGTQADNLKARPYCYTIMPQNVLDIAFDEAGRVKWALVREEYRDDDDPFTAADQPAVRYRLWQKGSWALFSDTGQPLDQGETGLDVVPIIPLDNEELTAFVGQSMVADIAYLDRAIFNNWSRLDTIVCEQTFSQLIFPVEGLAADIVENPALREQFMTLATNRILLYSAAAQAAPQFISPDASQAEFILSMLEKQTKQLYATLGLQGETGTEAKSQSGVAKAYDFEKLNKLLAAKADNLEAAEKTIYELAAQWLNVGQVEVVVDYPDDFDVKSLMDEIEMAERLSLMDISATFKKELDKLIVAKALPKLSEKTRRQIDKEIDTRAEEAEEAAKQPVFDFDTQPNPFNENG